MSKKRQKKQAAFLNICIKLLAVLLTMALVIIMVINAPIISYRASDSEPYRQLSIRNYIKEQKPVQYIEGTIRSMDADRVVLRDDVDVNFNDGLDLHQTIEGQFTVLFLGFDTETNGSGTLTDVNYLIQFNLLTASMNILQIPRDTYMPNYTRSSTNKFNSIYTLGDPQQSGIQRVVDAVQESFGIPVDAYVTTNCDKVAEIVDIVGGVPIDLPYTVVFEADKILYEGQQTLNGIQSEWFLRFRNGYEYADIGRVQAQRIFMAAAMKKAISMSSVQIFSAVDQVYGRELIATDMSLGDISRLADLAGTIDMANVHVFMLPGEAAMVYDQSVWSVHKQAALNIVNTYFRTQQVPLQKHQSTLVEWVPEGSYTSTAFDDTAASFDEIDDGSADSPELRSSYQNRIG